MDKKRIVVCMDGTWQSLRQDKPTNIALIARSVAHKETVRDANGHVSYIHQMVLYSQGVGAATTAIPGRNLISSVNSYVNRLFGGAFGDGLEDGILDVYLRLCFNYEEGDEIYIFGFSRGAFAARRLAGLINTSGILSRRNIHKAWDAYTLYHNAPSRGATDGKRQEHEEQALQFRKLYGKGGRRPDGTRTEVGEPPSIRFLGVFDTVVQRGLGGIIASATGWGRRRFKFKNFLVCPNVEAARHAVAVDERRWTFTPTLWEGLGDSNATARVKLGTPDRTYYHQRWFIGTHGDIGGGEGSKLSAVTLKWMTDGAAEMGLRFYATHGDDRSPLDDAFAEIDKAYDSAITVPPLWKRLLYPIHYPIHARTAWLDRKVHPADTDVDLYLDATVVQRITADHVRPRYNPPSLRAFRKLFKAMIKKLRGR